MKNLIDRKPKLRLTKVWLEINEEEGLGRVEGKFIYLTPNDYNLLSDAMKALNGVRPENMLLDGCRIETAMQLSNEKNSRSGNVFSRPTVYATTGNIPLGRPYDTIRVPDGATLTIDSVRLPSASQMLNNNLDCVIIIENGAVMENLTLFIKTIPQQIKQKALIVYRGHGKDAEAVISWVLSLDSAVKILIASDFDPAGFKIMMDYKRENASTFMLSPIIGEIKRVLDEGLLRVQLSDSDRFENQNRELSLVKNKINNESFTEEFCSVFKLVECEKYAISQETMIAHHINLEAVLI